jgi:hypothetical protein
LFRRSSWKVRHGWRPSEYALLALAMAYGLIRLLATIRFLRRSRFGSLKVAVKALKRPAK